MSFLSNLGLRSVSVSENNHGRVLDENEVTPQQKTVTTFDSAFRPRLTGTDLRLRFSFTPTIVYKHSESGKFIVLPFLYIGYTGRFVVEEPDCEDCQDDGGCAHCELPHCNSNEITFKVGQKMITIRHNDQFEYKDKEGNWCGIDTKTQL